MENLKLCPFCGGIPELTHRTDRVIGAEIEIEWSIRCPFCFCQRVRKGHYNVGNDGKLYLVVLELLAIFSKLDDRTGGKRHENQGNDVAGSRDVAGGRGEDL